MISNITRYEDRTDSDSLKLMCAVVCKLKFVSLTLFTHAPPRETVSQLSSQRSVSMSL